MDGLQPQNHDKTSRHKEKLLHQIKTRIPVLHPIRQPSGGRINHHHGSNHQPDNHIPEHLVPLKPYFILPIKHNRVSYNPPA